MLLEGRFVVITGAGSGIGRALAISLGEAGARLMLVGRRLSALDETASLLPPDTQSQKIVADITTAQGRAAVVAACRDGGIDILINNAGVVASGLLGELDDAGLAAMLATNVAAPILLSRDLLPLLRRSDRPRIVNVGSVFGDIGHPYFAAYCATKFALRGVSDALRRELAADGIAVTYAAPRATRTAAADGFHDLVAPFAMAMDDPSVVAKRVVAAIRDERSVVYARGMEYAFVWLQRLLPGVIDRALAAKGKKVRAYLQARHTT